MDWTAFWTGTAAVVGLLTLVVVAVGGRLGYLQLKITGVSGELEASRALLGATDESAYRPVRRILYERGFHAKLVAALAALPDGTNPSKALDDLLATCSTGGEVSDHDALHGYVASLESVAMLFLYDLAKDVLVLAYFGRIVVHHWELLQPYVQRMRAYYGYREFLQHLEAWYGILTDPALVQAGPGGPSRYWTDRRALRKAKQKALLQLQSKR